jgi:AraC-like DNA-binding protein
LNFSDPFVFSKYFKKHTGLSPKHYRNQLAVNR